MTSICALCDRPGADLVVLHCCHSFCLDCLFGWVGLGAHSGLANSQVILCLTCDSETQVFWENEQDELTDTGTWETTSMSLVCHLDRPLF
jgi:hypothetical protein